jgi:peptidoglycan/xylan/chitin deacetylase (PgdA/CDA1 family)
MKRNMSGRGLARSTARFFGSHHDLEYAALVVGIVLFVGSVSFAGRSYSDYRRASELVRTGDRLLAAEEYSAALVEYKQAERISWVNRDARDRVKQVTTLQNSHKHLIAGLSAYNHKSFAEALLQFALVSRTDPNYSFAQAVLSADKQAGANEQKAVASFNDYYNQTVGAYNAKNYSDTSSLADKALALVSGDYHFDQAKINELKQKKEAAKQALAQALVSSVSSVSVGYGLRVPILMYHYIRVNPDPNDATGFSLSVTPSEFDAQMGYLAANGYHAVDVATVAQALRGKSGLPSKPIVITFDDGYIDFYTTALPILQKYGLRGESYVISTFIGGGRYMDWDMIRAAHASGLVTIGSHTVTHAYLSGLSGQALHDEIFNSKQMIEAQIGAPVTDFCYPYGAYSAAAAAMVAQAGYADATTTATGYSHSDSSLYTLSRVRVSGGEDLGTFISRL